MALEDRATDSKSVSEKATEANCHPAGARCGGRRRQACCERLGASPRSVSDACVCVVLQYTVQGEPKLFTLPVAWPRLRACGNDNPCTSRMAGERNSCATEHFHFKTAWSAVISDQRHKNVALRTLANTETWHIYLPTMSGWRSAPAYGAEAMAMRAKRGVDTNPTPQARQLRKPAPLHNS